MRNWSVEEVLTCLKHGQPVRDARVADVLDLRSLCEADGDRVCEQVHFDHCDLQRLSADCIEFEAPVIFENTVVRAAASFWATYFFRGFRAIGCRFESGLDNQCGGHNKGGTEVALIDTTFGGFANFFDCWFEGPVILRTCKFEAGTNLFGNIGEPFEVRFDVPPTIDKTTGTLNLSGG